MTVHRLKTSAVTRQQALEAQKLYNSHTTHRDVRNCKDANVLDLQQLVAIRELEKLGYVWNILVADSQEEADDDEYIPNAVLFLELLVEAEYEAASN